MTPSCLGSQVTIFDWDDTLLCTTHLETLQRQHGALPAAVREQLVALESVVLNLLQQVRTMRAKRDDKP